MNKFKEGDWIVILNCPNKNIVNKAQHIVNISKDINDEIFFTYEEGWSHLYNTELRSATDDEIKFELERRWWAKLNRNIGELRDGDIVRINYGHEVPEGLYEIKFTVNGKDDGEKCNAMWLRNDRDGCYNAMNNDFGTAKLVTTAQYRFDI